MNILHVTDGYGKHRYYKNGRQISHAEFKRIDKAGMSYSYDRKNGANYFRWTA